MIDFVSYFSAEYKKMRRHLFSLFAGTALLIGLIAAVLFLVARDGSQEKIRPTRVGLVMGENEGFAGFVSGAMNSLGDIGEAFFFEEMSEEDGMRALKEGELTSLIVVPDGYVESLILGTNKPVIIRYAASRAGLPALLMKQLVGAASSYILDTEAGIYAVKDWYRNIGAALPATNESELNWKYLNTVLSRNTSVQEELIDTTETLEPATYYLVCGIALWLLMIGLGCRGMFAPDGASLSALLAVRGVSYLSQSIGHGLAFLGTYGMYYLAVAVPLSVIGYVTKGFPLFSWMLILPAAWLASSVIRLVYTVIRDPVYAIVLLLLLLIVMGYLSGYFYPIQYLPASIRAVGQWMPTRFVFRLIRDVFAGEVTPAVLLLPCLYAVVLDAASVLLGFRFRVRRWAA